MLLITFNVYKNCLLDRLSPTVVYIFTEVTKVCIEQEKTPIRPQVQKRSNFSPYDLDIYNYKNICRKIAGSSSHLESLPPKNKMVAQLASCRLLCLFL